MHQMGVGFLVPDLMGLEVNDAMPHAPEMHPDTADGNRAPASRAIGEARRLKDAAPSLAPVRSVARVPVSVWVLTFSALALRLAMVFLWGRFDDSTAIEHSSIAEGILLGNGFAFGDFDHYGPSSVQSPPYPLLLTLLYWLFGVDSPLAHGTAQVINAFAGAATVPLIYMMVRLARGTHLVGLIAASMLVFWPTQLLAVAYVQAVTVITFCTVAIVVLWYRSIDTGRLAPWVAYGMIGCLGALTEPVLLPPMALSGVIILLHPKLDAATRLRNGVILLTCAIVIIGPWTWRNYRVHGTFMPIKSTFWVNVWKGNNPNDASGTDRPALSEARLRAFQERGIDEARQYDLLAPEQVAELQGKTDVEREAIFKRYTTTFIAENPRGYVERCVRRLVKTLFADWDHPMGRTGSWAYFGSRGFLLVGSVLGLILALRRRWRIGLPALITGLSLLTYTLTITAARFAFPLEPFQIALTALALGWLLSPVIRQRERPPIVEGFVGVRNDGC